MIVFGVFNVHGAIFPWLRSIIGDEVISLVSLLVLCRMVPGVLNFCCVGLLVCRQEYCCILVYLTLLYGVS